MSDPETISVMQAELDRDRLDLQDAVRQMHELSANAPHVGFQVAWLGIRLRAKIEMLSYRTFRSNLHLAGARRRSE